MAAAIVVIVGVDASRQAELAFDCKYITNFIFFRPDNRFIYLFCLLRIKCSTETYIGLGQQTNTDKQYNHLKSKQFD